MSPSSDRPASRERARELADFFASVSPRLFADLVASGAVAAADPVAEREWSAVALHACVRGVVSDDAPEASAEAADLVDDFHDAVLARPAASAAQSEWRALLAARYGEYDGIARTLGQKGAAKVPAAIARAAARHMSAADSRVLADVIAPLLEALAEGATATIAGAPGTPAPVDAIRMPPVDGLRRITTRLDDAGIAWAVGASGLLASLGLVDEVNDWDVQVEADPTAVRALYPDLPHAFHGHGGCHADWKLAFQAEQTELIPCFAFFVSDAVVRVALHVSGTWRGLPIASPEGWACAYGIMGLLDEPSLRARRAARSEMLFAWLAEHGADARRVEELLEEPLPEALASRLAALPRK